MSHDEYQAIEQIGIDVAQLSTLLAFGARGLDGQETDAVEACATLAETIANQVDNPGFPGSAARSAGGTVMTPEAIKALEGALARLTHIETGRS